MNRRQFVATTALTIPAIAMAGCSVNVLEAANTFIAMAKAIIAADPNGAFVPDLQLAITAMQTAIAGWNGSTLNCALYSACNSAAQIIDSIDPGSTVALIAAVAVAAFDALEATTGWGNGCTAPVSVRTMRSNYRGRPAWQAQKTGIEKAMFPVHAAKSRFNRAAEDSGLTVRV